jgi:hypothetical protein
LILVDPLKPYKNILVDFNKDNKIYEKITQLLLYQGHDDFIKSITEWTIPLFPIHGDMIAKIGVPKGPLFSKIINDLKEIWKNEFNFCVDKSVLLERASELYKQLK